MFEVEAVDQFDEVVAGFGGVAFFLVDIDLFGVIDELSEVPLHERGRVAIGADGITEAEVVLGGDTVAVGF
ncbi:MAG: hypothetical protein RI897_2164 [Verrucomicrobiota bacterium]